MSADRPRRGAIVALAVIGVALIATPIAFQMFERAPKGAQMIKAFKPFMTVSRLDGFQTDLRYIDHGVHEGAGSVLPAVATSAAAHRRPVPSFSDFVAFEGQWRGIYPDMNGMLTTIQHNLGNYQAVAALPNFALFPWFFVIPGVLVLALLGLGLARPTRWRTVRWLLVALGVGLVLAPAVFQMFSRAPKGGHMMTAFKTIETRARVQRIQGYFSEIAVGEGAVQLELVPALQRSGLSTSEIASRYPGVTAFDAEWIHILNDLTPMIGAMSDNVPNYQAVAALPPFPLFPWFFVLPGLLLAGFAVAAGPRRARRGRDMSASPNPDAPRSLTEGVT